MQYQEAEIFVKNELSKIRNIKRFCSNNNLNYQLVIKIKNGSTTKKYPLLISKLCTIFGKNITIHINKQYHGDNI